MIADVWPLVSAATMRGLDRHTIETLGVDSVLLMECAGRAVASAALGLASRTSGGRGLTVQVLCGTGNNGGDGWVAARHLHLEGVAVEVVVLGDPSRLSPDAAANRTRALAAGVRETRDFEPKPGGGVIFVDALFGTGLARDLDAAAGERVVRLNEARARGAGQVLAVDLPSGLDADTGQVRGVAVQADATLCLGLPKLGLALEPGRGLAGRITLARIGIADSAPGLEPDATLLTRAAAGRRLPARPASGHKGSFGHVLVVAGSEGKSGAAALATEAAARSGAGLVTVACPASLNPILEARCTEAMTAPQPETPGGALGDAAEKPILDLAASRDVVVLGPGIGRASETLALVRRLVPALDAALVLDADGLVAFGEQPDALIARRGATVLTPHPGEAAALLGETAAALNRDRIGAARELARRTGAVAVLKGAASVVAAPDGAVAVNPTGGPLLASGGTGDVLAGLIAGLLGQGLDAFEAARIGVYLHGAAADRLGRRRGESGVLAGELAAALPEAAQALREAALEPAGPRHGDALAFPERG